MRVVLRCLCVGVVLHCVSGHGAAVTFDQILLGQAEKDLPGVKL
jgi:hypothetical protein